MSSLMNGIQRSTLVKDPESQGSHTRSLSLRWGVLQKNQGFIQDFFLGRGGKSLGRRGAHTFD